MKPGTRVEAAAVVLAAALAGLPLLGSQLLAGHDVTTYLAYAAQGAALAREGVFLPAWGGDLNGGFGGPGLLFYPPLVNVPHVLLLLAGLPPAVGIGLAAVILLALSGLALVGWLRAEGLGGAALPAALAYVLSPYRLVDVYERSALSENLAFLFPPLVLWALAASRPVSPARRVVLVAFPVAGLLLSNLPAAFLFGTVLAVIVLHPATGGGRRGAAVAGAILGAGLAAFALLPAAFSSRWCATELFYSGASPHFRPSRHVLFGPAELNPTFGRSVSWVLVVLATLVFAASVLGRRTGAPDRRRTVWAAVALVAFLSTLPPAGWIWDSLPLLSKLQFPWRLATVLTLALAALVAHLPRRTAFALAGVAALAGLPWWGRSAVPLSALPPAPAVATTRGTAFPNPGLVHDAAGSSTHRWIRNPLLVDPWFVPRSVSAPFWSALVASAWDPSAPAVGPGPVASESGGVSARVLSWSALAGRVEVEASPGTLLLHQLAFAGHRVFVDGSERAARPDGRTGLLSVDVPAGRHEVSWRWEPFPFLRRARLVSLVALAAALVLLALPGVGRQPRAPGRRP